LRTLFIYFDLEIGKFVSLTCSTSLSADSAPSAAWWLAFWRASTASRVSSHVFRDESFRRWRPAAAPDGQEVPKALSTAASVVAIRRELVSANF